MDGDHRDPDDRQRAALERLPNPNVSWLEPLGVRAVVMAVLPDEIKPIAGFLREHTPRVDLLLPLTTPCV